MIHYFAAGSKPIRRLLVVLFCLFLLIAVALQVVFDEERLKLTKSCPLCYLTNADLRGADLDGANLRWANLSSADLTEASLIGADLRGGKLVSADLSGAVLSRAKLNEVNLGGAFLIGANLSEVDFRGAKIGGTLRKAILKGADLRDVDFSVADLKGNIIGADLSEADLREADLRGSNLSRANLYRSTLIDANLSEADLSGADLSGADLSGTILAGTSFENVTLVRAFLGKAKFFGANLRNANFEEADLRGAMLSGFDMSGADFTRSNLSDADLSGATLTGASLIRAYLPGANLYNSILVDADLREAYLYETNLVGADLRRSILVGAKLTGADLSKANLIGADLDLSYQGRDALVKHSFRIPINTALEYSAATSIHISGGKGYLTVQQGRLYGIENGKLSELLDLSNDPLFFSGGESGLLGVTARNNLIYLSYTVRNGKGPDIDLIVDEYTAELEKKRNIISIHFPTDWHHGGTITFDKFGRLYLSTGDGEGRDPENKAQDIASLRGKILRFDIEKESPQAEVVAYGLRNPWKFSIDSENRMFIGDVGGIWRESVYFLEHLYPETPYNLGHNVFEGTKRMHDGRLEFSSTLPPIFEYEHHREGHPISVIGGYYLDDFHIYLLGDLSGNIRFLEKQENEGWREVHFQRTPEGVTTFGYDRVDKRVYMGGVIEVYELDMSNISKEQIDNLPWPIFCRTTMPDGSENNSGCE